MASACNVCCDYFNKSTRTEVKCCFGDCGFIACKRCVRTYLLSITNDPHCMNCKKNWSQNFITVNLNRSFISQEYKETRMKLLLDREMSKMPQTMEAAQKEKEIEKEKGIISQIDEELDQLQKTMIELNNIKRFRRGQINALQNKSENNGAERRKFIMQCPSNDCRGFLSSQYKCEMCYMYTCPKCHIIIGTNNNIEHICNEDMVKSAQLIKNETKPCPSCGTRISKISGCNQMWCTNCNVAFGWNSGIIDTGPVHNPHFYEYQKKLTATHLAPRNPGDVVCGGICNYMTLRTVMNKITRTKYFLENRDLVKDLFNMINSLHRMGVHTSQVLLPYYREQIRDTDHNESLRVQYILKKKTKEELATIIYTRDFTRKKNSEVLHILELINVSIIEIFAQIVDSKQIVPEIIDEIGQYNNNFQILVDYCNEQLQEISVTYNRTVPRIEEISNEWLLTNKKYSGYSHIKKSEINK